MSKPANMQMEIYQFILDSMKEGYRDGRTMERIVLQAFQSKQEIVHFVYESGRYVDSSLQGDPQYALRENQKYVSKNTIHRAIDSLISDGKIVEQATEQGHVYKYFPDYSVERQKFPILDIASNIDVGLCVPEDIVFLTVPEMYVDAVVDYLRAQFHQNDVLFIPFKGIIMCAYILPKSSLDDPDFTPTDYKRKLFGRIKSVLHDFNISCSDHRYHYNYQNEYALLHDDALRASMIASLNILKQQGEVPPETSAGDFLGRLALLLSSGVLDEYNIDPISDMVSDPHHSLSHAILKSKFEEGEFQQPDASDEEKSESSLDITNDK